MILCGAYTPFWRSAVPTAFPAHHDRLRWPRWLCWDEGLSCEPPPVQIWRLEVPAPLQTTMSWANVYAISKNILISKHAFKCAILQGYCITKVYCKLWLYDQILLSCKHRNLIWIWQKTWTAEHTSLQLATCIYTVWRVYLTYIPRSCKRWQPLFGWRVQSGDPSQRHLAGSTCKPREKG